MLGGKGLPTMYEAAVDLNRRFARDVFGEQYGRTVSEKVGDSLDSAFGLQRGLGKDLFHGTLIVGGVVGLGLLLLSK
jgi:hypothetical protein